MVINKNMKIFSKMRKIIKQIKIKQQIHMKKVS